MSQLMHQVNEHFRYELLFFGGEKLRLTFFNDIMTGLGTTDNVTIDEVERSAYQILDLCALARQKGLNNSEIKTEGS